MISHLPDRTVIISPLIARARNKIKYGSLISSSHKPFFVSFPCPGFSGRLFRWQGSIGRTRVNLKRSHTVLIGIYAKVNSRTYQIIFEMTLDQRVKCEDCQKFTPNSLPSMVSGLDGHQSNRTQQVLGSNWSRLFADP